MTSTAVTIGGSSCSIASEPVARAHATTVRVRYAETDAQGVAYHAHYFVWLEVARTALLAEAGYPYRALEADGLFFAVVDARCRYAGAARYDDEVRIEAAVRNIRSRMVVFGYNLTVEGRLIAEAETTLVAMDEARRPVRIPGNVARALEIDA